jgi:hypothetical protein
MSNAKNAVAARIRAVLADDLKDQKSLSHDVIAVLAESAILLETQCEADAMAIQVAVMAASEVSKFVSEFSRGARDGRDGAPRTARVAYSAGGSVGCSSDASSVILERLVLEQLKTQGADTPEKVSEMLKAMGADAEICARVAGYAAAEASCGTWAGFASAPFSRNGA